ncbi:hypothetical protein bAD24_III02210 [Burkholderia sp. AD24]|nr:hypothetical protein bAD24_III02210 [Burkholderia sp. AD24]
MLRHIATGLLDVVYEEEGTSSFARAVLDINAWAG